MLTLVAKSEIAFVRGFDVSSMAGLNLLWSWLLLLVLPMRGLGYFVFPGSAVAGCVVLLGTLRGLLASL